MYKITNHTIYSTIIPNIKHIHTIYSKYVILHKDEGDIL